MRERLVGRWPALVLIALVGSGVAEAASQSASATAEAFGVFASTPTADQPRSPYATVPTGGWMGEDEALSVSVPGVVAAENLFAIATGAGDTHDVSAEASATAERIDILNGLITADGVVALASSALHGTTANANSEGSHFVELVVNGVTMPAEIAPNTRVDLPGVGYVILNEQVRRGDGVNDIGLTVNMLRVVLQDALTGATTGEIIVGSASSYVAR